MRFEFTCDFEGWRWSRRWHRIVCWFAGHPRYVGPKPILEQGFVFTLNSGLRCSRCGARPPHYELPPSRHGFTWADR